jgi:hypothetical protein
MGKIARTFSLMRASWLVLRNDKKLLLFPFLSGIFCFLIVAGFLVPSYPDGILWLDTSSAPIDQKLNYYSVLFLFFFCQYLVIIFFNSAIIAGATIRMGGGDPRVSDGFKAAIARFPLITAWALVQTGVQVALIVIRRLRSEEDTEGASGSEIVADLAGTAWGVATFLVVPIMVIDRKGPFRAIKESSSLLKKTWGEQLVGHFSFGLVFFLLAVPALIPVFAFVLVVDGVLTIPLAGPIGKALLTTAALSVLYLIFVWVIESALRGIFKAALYLYTRDGEVPAGFQLEMLRNSIVPK